MIIKQKAINIYIKKRWKKVSHSEKNIYLSKYQKSERNKYLPASDPKVTIYIGSFGGDSAVIPF